jgi:hypothetical protein
MDSKIQRRIQIAERLMRELDNKVPPQTELLDELRSLLAELRNGRS